MIIDGRALAKEVLARTKARAEALPRRPKVVAYAFSATPATRSYLKIKARSAEAAGCDFSVRESLPLSFDTDAVIVQLPLPAEMDTKAILDSITVDKDADVLSSAARVAFEMIDLRNPSLLPPVVGAVQKILESGNIEVRGKKAVVLGDGWLVGKPVATWLTQQGAEVAVITLSDFAGARATLAQADVIVSGAGSPHFIKPEMLKEGVTLIDAGTSESDGTLAGDADPVCADKCSLFTPVPGGVGPVAVAYLFENVVTLAERAIHS